MTENIENVIRAWTISSDLHRFNHGASEPLILEAEVVLQRRLPLAIRTLYEFSNGASLFHGNLSINPLKAESQELCLAHNSEWLRSCGWIIPPEIVVFGNSGSDSMYGVWLPSGSEQQADAPVLELGEACDGSCIALVGTSFVRFAMMATAFCLLGEDQEYQEALDVIGVPPQGRSSTPDQSTYEAIYRWADADLPQIPPDPYGAPISLKWLRANFGAG